MRVLVIGGWHLALVTSACLAAKGHQVDLVPEENEQIEHLKQSLLPIDEPGLTDLFRKMTTESRLAVSSLDEIQAESYDAVWVAVDTPVDHNDNANVEYVIEIAVHVLQKFRHRTVIINSSQLPVGSVERIQSEVRARSLVTHEIVAVPENLRLGNAIEAFLHPDRVIVGANTHEGRQCAIKLLEPITARLEFMSVRSAEMVKHALNAFLGTSVAFANSISTICEKVGADAADVARGLKTDVRIGSKAYLRPGEAFAGGTLARDLRYLDTLWGHCEPSMPGVFSAVLNTNEAHKKWTLKVLVEQFPDLKKKRILLAGLTYKADTSTLRRSVAVEVSEDLLDCQTNVDVLEKTSAVSASDIDQRMRIINPAELPEHEYDAIVVGTLNQQLRAVMLKYLNGIARPTFVVDPNAILRSELEGDRHLYRTVGVTKYCG